MRLEVLVEEESAAAALAGIMEQVVGDNSEVDVAFRRFRGKPDLLKQLPSRLRGYNAWIREAGVRVVILIDQDKQDCKELKGMLEQMAADAGLPTLTRSEDRTQALVATRIAVEELEAWFFGDMAAVAAAYPKINSALAKKARYRHPDSIKDPAEAFERVLQAKGYHPTGLRKISAANDVSRHMDVAGNTSPSFQVFVAGVRTLVGATHA